MSNTAIWDALGKTDPAQTKQFSRSGGFKGTAIKPQWMIKRLTEQFGPVGCGWGMGRPHFETVRADEGEVMVYCTVECWHTDPANTFWGVGGEKAIGRNKNGLFHDDEAFKKAYTDAVGNAFKFLGVAADIHMGQFDDSKYVQQMEREFAPKPEAPPTITDAQLDELQMLFTHLSVPVADFLAVAKVPNLKALPAPWFDRAKKWVNDKAAEKRAKQDDTLADDAAFLAGDVA